MLADTEVSGVDDSEVRETVAVSVLRMVETVVIVSRVTTPEVVIVLVTGQVVRVVCTISVVYTGTVMSGPCEEVASVGELLTVELSEVEGVLSKEDSPGCVSTGCVAGAV